MTATGNWGIRKAKHNERIQSVSNDVFELGRSGGVTESDASPEGHMPWPSSMCLAVNLILIDI